MFNVYEWASIVQWVLCVAAVFGAGMFARRGEHARTAFTLMFALLMIRAGFSNWQRGGNEIPAWVLQDRFTLVNAVGLLVSYLAFLWETHRRRAVAS